MTDCIFCRIGAGELPAHRVHQSPRVVAFLDIHPIRPGHVQVMPREHFEYFDALPADVAAEVFAVAQRLAPILRTLYGVQRVAFMFTGSDIEHAHAHVVPMVEPTDITSRQYILEENVTFVPAARAPDTDLARTAERIRSGLE